MELKERQLTEIHQIVKKNITILDKAYEAVMDEDVSKYPIFVFYNQNVELGIPLLYSNDIGSEWEINITTLEEMNVKQLVSTEKVQDFISLYKKNIKKYCVFAVGDFGATFVFIPK
jgi:hypothetical protein